jgi:uncharacterized protein YuzE
MKQEEFQKAKIEYHYEEDIFSARPLKRNYDNSMQIGDLIFDLDENGKINGLEILNASKIFNIPKLALKNMVSGKIIVEVNKKYIKLEVNINSVLRNAEKATTLNLERIRPELFQPMELKMAVI